MRTYKIAKGWGIFVLIFSPLIIIGFAYLLTMPFQNGDFTPNASWILIPISLAMIIVALIAILDVFKSRLIIEENKIIYISTFYARELHHDDIKGFTVNENYTFVQPKDKYNKRIKISKYFGGYDEINQWLVEHYTDLDLQAEQEEEKQIFENEDYGLTEDARLEKLTKAKNRASVMNWVGGIAAVWGFFFPTPYQWCMIVLMIIPLVAIAVAKFSNGLIRLDDHKGSLYPSVLNAILFPSLALALRALIDFEVFDHKNVWPLMGGLTALLLFYLLFKQKELELKKSNTKSIVSIVGISLLLLAYSFGFIIHVNCYYDNSEGEFYSATVLDKRITSGKSTTRYLELTAWGPQQEVDEVDVDKTTYNNTEIGDTVDIYYSKGKLNIPWFQVQ